MGIIGNRLLRLFSYITDDFTLDKHNLPINLHFFKKRQNLTKSNKDSKLDVNTNHKEYSHVPEYQNTL